METQPSLFRRIKTALIGRGRNLQDRSIYHALSLSAFLAWVGLGADGLSSACYGPEEAFLALGSHTYLGLLVALGSAITVFVISASYMQIIELFPGGGGGYLVASKMLNPTLGMVSGCALLIDYVLTVAISIAAGADALFSFLPLEWHSFKLAFAVAGVILLVLLNLRGIRESVVPLIPIMLTFVLAHLVTILYAWTSHADNLVDVVSGTANDFSEAYSDIGFLGIFFLLLRSYSFGAGTYTGIEAVANGMPVIQEPRVENGKKTMRYMAISLAVIVVGLVISYLLFDVRPVPGKTLNAVLLEGITANWNSSIGASFVFITLLSEAALLFVAAQTGFLGGPRVLANMALDRWFPTRFTNLSDRLVTHNGILLMGALAIVLILATGGSVRFLVVLYSITVFIDFTLSQLGMVRHWWKNRRSEFRWRRRITINTIGFGMSAFILVSMSILKFFEGGWLTLLVTSVLVSIALGIKRHYRHTALQLKRLDEPLIAAMQVSEQSERLPAQPMKPTQGDKTAVILVSGFNGLGIHTLLNVISLFEGSFKNYVFLQIGIVDVGNFKGTAEVERLKEHIDAEGQRYVDYVQRHGLYAESYTSIGVDVLEELDNLVPQITAKYSRVVFFGGQLVFRRETFLNRWLHNQTIFSVQKRLYHQGLPVVILPIRV